MPRRIHALSKALPTMTIAALGRTHEAVMLFLLGNMHLGIVLHGHFLLLRSQWQRLYRSLQD